MLCPKCKKELNYLPWLGQIWECRHCGYRGVIAIENNTSARTKYKNNISAVQTATRKNTKAQSAQKLNKISERTKQKFKQAQSSQKLSRKNENQLWKLLKKIPEEKVTTYKILAGKLGIHQRTVGILLRKNRYPGTYPCYKVVRTDGSLGGYSRGIRKKIKLLKGDGIEIKGGKVDLRECLFRF